MNLTGIDWPFSQVSQFISENFVRPENALKILKASKKPWIIIGAATLILAADIVIGQNIRITRVEPSESDENLTA